MSGEKIQIPPVHIMMGEEELEELKREIEKIEEDERNLLLNKQLMESSSKTKLTALKLYELEIDKIPMLIEPIFPKVGLVSLVGASDVGKSTFLKQMALSIVLGFDDFLNYKINPNTKKILYVSTEDDPSSTSISLKKQVNALTNDKEFNIQDLENLRFLFEINLIKGDKNSLHNILENDYKDGIDLIIIDAFTDVFSGDINSSTKVREFLNKFTKIALDYRCLVMFLHHIGKRTNKYFASKDNVLGSQAFEAKMRALVEIKEMPGTPENRTITITKGNYISSKIKMNSKVLNFNEETLLFTDTGRVLNTKMKPKYTDRKGKKEEIFNLIKMFNKEKKSVREITKILNEKGYKIGKSTVGNFLKDIS